MFKKLVFIICLSLNLSANDFMKDWSDIAEYSFEDLSPNITSATGSSISSNTFIINLVKQNKNNFIIVFALGRVVNGGVFLDEYNSTGNEYCDEDHTDCPDKLLVILTPINSTKAIISFDKIPSCKLEAFKDTSNTLIIKGLENPDCESLKQEDQRYGVGGDSKVSLINENYYKIKAGFDCTKAKTKAENIICQNKDLALFDREVNTAYEAAKEFLDLKALLQSQRKYLKARNNCKDSKCIEQIMQDRIRELNYKVWKGIIKDQEENK